MRFHSAAASKGDLREWMLDPPSRRLRFFDAKGALLGDVRIGKYYTEEEVFAMRDGEQRVGLLKFELLKTLPQNLDDFIDSDRIQ